MPRTKTRLKWIKERMCEKKVRLERFDRDETVIRGSSGTCLFRQRNNIGFFPECGKGGRGNRSIKGHG